MVDGNPYLNRDPDTFKLLLQYLRNDRYKPEILDPLQKQFFEQEVKYWDLLDSDISKHIDFKVVTMLQSFPKINNNWSQKALEVWKKLGPLDLNEVH